MTAKLS